MTKKTKIKIALLGSLVSLVICVGILIGVSYAFEKIDSTQSVNPYKNQYYQGSAFEDLMQKVQAGALRSTSGSSQGFFLPDLHTR